MGLASQWTDRIDIKIPNRRNPLRQWPRLSANLWRRQGVIKQDIKWPTDLYTLGNLLRPHNQPEEKEWILELKGDQLSQSFLHLPHSKYLEQTSQLHFHFLDLWNRKYHQVCQRYFFRLHPKTLQTSQSLKSNCRYSSAWKWLLVVKRKKTLN